MAEDDQRLYPFTAFNFAVEIDLTEIAERQPAAVQRGVFRVRRPGDDHGGQNAA